MSDCYWSEESLLSLIGQAITRDTRNKDREKTLGQAQLFNIGTIKSMDVNKGQAQVKLSLLRSVSLKTGPLDSDSNPMLSYSSHAQHLQLANPNFQLF